MDNIAIGKDLTFCYFIFNFVHDYNGFSFFIFNYDAQFIMNLCKVPAERLQIRNKKIIQLVKIKLNHPMLH